MAPITRISTKSIRDVSCVGNMSTKPPAHVTIAGTYLVFVPEAMIDHLPQQFNWWLGAVLLLLRHVKVIDE